MKEVRCLNLSWIHDSYHSLRRPTIGPIIDQRGQRSPSSKGNDAFPPYFRVPPLFGIFVTLGKFLELFQKYYISSTIFLVIDCEFRISLNFRKHATFQFLPVFAVLYCLKYDIQHIIAPIS